MDLSQLKNNKYFLGKFTDLGKYNGWFVGDFFEENHPCKTNQIEILYREHKPGDFEKPHYHAQKIELLIMLEGRARYNVNGHDVEMSKGDFLFVDVNNVISGEFIEPSKIFAIHSPSIPTDKTVVE